MWQVPARSVRAEGRRAVRAGGEARRSVKVVRVLLAGARYRGSVKPSRPLSSSPSPE